MPQRALASSALMRPLVVLALPGMYLLYKYNQYRQQQMETARRRVTERELAHLNHKIVFEHTFSVAVRAYAKKKSCEKPKVKCEVIDRKKFADQCKEKKAQVVKFLKRVVNLNYVDGGTNFNAPYKALDCAEIKKAKCVCNPPDPCGPPPQAPCDVCSVRVSPKPGDILVKHRPYCPPEARPGIRVSVLGAETRTGQFLSLMLKQNPYINKLKLFDDKCKASNSQSACSIRSDLLMINTNCSVDAFTGTDFELDKSLQGADLVLMLGGASGWCRGAACVKRYAEAAARQCPRAIIVVAAEPVDRLMVIVTETFIEMGWYDPRRIIGSMSLPESRANALAALHLGLDPRYINVPCIGGSSGAALVPVNSSVIDYLSFTNPETERLVQTARKSDTLGPASEAHALHKLSERVAKALLCEDRPVMSAYVANDSWQFIAPTRFFANPVRLGPRGIEKNLGVPKLNQAETALLDTALIKLTCRIDQATYWYCRNSFCARSPQECWKQPPLQVPKKETDCIDYEARCCRY